MTEINDDLKLSLESTWIESNGSGYDRVVVLNFFTVDCLSSSPENVLKAVGPALRERVISKLDREIGLVHEADYIFGVYDSPKMRNGRWAPGPIPSDMRTIIRLRDEENFTMLKMHYSN